MTESLLIMLNDIPPLSRNDPLLNEIYSAINKLVGKLNSNIDVVFNERFVDLANGIGLQYFEERLGIKTDASKPLGQRRSLIKARLRVKGKISLKKVQNICESWVNGSITPSISGSTIKIKFVSFGGVPEGIVDLEKTLFNTIPTHLNVAWEFSYMTWDMFESHNWSWDEFESQNLTWDELEILVS